MILHPEVFSLNDLQVDPEGEHKFVYDTRQEVNISVNMRSKVFSEYTV